MLWALNLQVHQGDGVFSHLPPTLKHRKVCSCAIRTAKQEKIQRKTSTGCSDPVRAPEACWVFKPQTSLRNKTKYAGTRAPCSGLALQVVECHLGLTQGGSGEYQTQVQLQGCLFPGHEVTTGEAQTQLLFVTALHQDGNWLQNMTPPLSKRL